MVSPRAVTVEWVFPAAGRVAVFSEEDGREFRRPLVGWGLKKGLLIPLDEREDGAVVDARRWPNFLRIGFA